MQDMVKNLPDDACNAFVVPAAVDEQQVGEKAELGDGEVGSHHGLHALLPADSHAHMCRLNLRSMWCLSYLMIVPSANGTASFRSCSWTQSP